jgi:SnoaL-like domain
MNTKAVVETFVRAWNENDEGARHKLLEQSWADDGIYSDPRAIVEGRNALLAHIAEFRERVPGGRIGIRSDVDEHGRNFRFGWATLDSGDAVLMEGVDFGQLAEDGRIASITGFFGPLP